MSNSFDRAAGGGRRWLLIGGGCLALLACVCVVAIVAVLALPGSLTAQMRQLLGLSGGASAAIEYVPPSAPMFGVVNPSFAQAASAKKVMDILGKNPAIKQALNGLASQTGGSGQNPDFNFDRDVAPWIGTELGFAMMDVPPAASGASSAPPGFVVMVASRDTAKSDDFLKRWRSAAEAKGSVFTEESYQGVTLVSARATSSATTPLSAYATYQNTVLLASTADALKKALDTKKSSGGANLSASAAYKSMIDKLPKDRALTMVVDVKALTKSLPAAATRSPGADGINAINDVGISMGFTDDGIRVDSVVAYDVANMSDPLKQLITVPANPDKALDYLPDSAIATLSGQNLKSYWDYYNSVLAQNPQSKKQFDQSIQAIKTQTGIDLDADVFAWMTGEFALAVVPAKALTVAGPTAPPVGLMLLLETKDAALAQQKMTKISTALGKQGLLFGAKKVNGADLQVVTGLEKQGLTAGYGFLDNFLVIGSADDVLTAAVDAQKAPLSKSAEFVLDYKVLPQANTGVGFFSIPNIVGVVKGELPPAQLSAFQANVEPALTNFKSLSLSNGVPAGGLQSTVIFIHVAE